MNYEPNIHHRRSIRLNGYDHPQPEIYLIMICTKNRECLFGKIKNGEMVLNNKGKIVLQCWLEMPSNSLNVELGEIVVMPNHIYGIIITENNLGATNELPIKNKTIANIRAQNRLMTLLKKIGLFKMNSAKQIRQICKTHGISIWQRNYYEHITHSKKELNKIREYIINNPLKLKKDEYY